MMVRSGASSFFIGLPAGRAGEGAGALHEAGEVSMYRDGEQRDFARGMRNEPTPAEAKLWREIRANQLGVKSRRQAAIGDYVVDFVCFEKKLVVELDGPQHLEPHAVEKDARRTAWLESQGFRLVRFRNQELDEDLRGVVEKIRQALG
jgi:very-short-patch-repair endonuclease